MAHIPESGSGDHAQTVANHYNKLEESGLQQRSRSRIFYLRNFNNWIKSVLIARTLEKLRAKDQCRKVSVLDLCSGKGGDLLKWKKGNIDHLVCADIAATSVEQCEIRYNDNRQRERNRLYDAEFIVADCTKALMMIRNASECLRVGGYFIGTTPNSYELIRRLRNSTNNTFGNEVYNISFAQEGKENFPLFGAKYNFHLEGVVDCPEFLVYFPVLERLAAQFGLKLVKRWSFADFFKHNVDHKQSSTLLSVMQALEPFPSMPGTEPMSADKDDYRSADEFLSSLRESQSQDHRRPLRIGTLSQAEWDAATLYLVFIFEKIEDIVPDFTPVHASHKTEQTEDSGDETVS